MKKIFLLILFISCFIASYSQSTLYIRGDTIVIKRDGGNSTLKIENATRTLNNAFLKNISGGRTAFAYAVDSVYKFGVGYLVIRYGTRTDTLTLPGGSGGEANTASNLSGTGVGIFKDKNLIDLRFKRLISAFGATVTDQTDSIQIKADTSSTGLSSYYLRRKDSALYATRPWVTNNFASKIHSHIFADITDGTSAVRNLFSGGTGISYNNSTGVITWTGAGSGITSLNTLTGSTQLFATGYSGTSFNISSSSNTHTFNIPIVSATDSGLVTTALFNSWNSRLLPADTVNKWVQDNYVRSDSLFKYKNGTETFLQRFYPYNTNPLGYLTSASITGKLNISDTASMLLPYQRDTDTTTWDATKTDILNANKYRFGKSGEDVTGAENRIFNANNNQFYIDSTSGFHFNTKKTGYRWGTIDADYSAIDLVSYLDGKELAYVGLSNASNMSNVVLETSGSGTNFSRFNLYPDSITFNQELGNYSIYALPQRTDTTANKVMTWNSSTKKMGWGNWFGGGGGTPTLQQVFNTEVGGSVLTKGDTINTSTYRLTISSTNASAHVRINNTNIGSDIYLGGTVPVSIYLNGSATNARELLTSLISTTSATATDGYGVGNYYAAEAADGGSYQIGENYWRWSNATNKTSHYRITGDSSNMQSIFLESQPNGIVRVNNNADTLATKAYARSAGGGGGYTNLTQFVDQTAWRVFYSNGSGDVTELALGADGTFLKSNGATSAPSFATPAGSGTVTNVSVVTANGFAGTVATSTTTPAITLTTSITGVLKGNGTAISAATAATDYIAPTDRRAAFQVAVGTDANITAAAGTAYSLPAATLTIARNIDMTNVNTNGDYVEIDNQEAGFTWTFTGQTVYDAYENAVTTLQTQIRYIIRRTNGKLKIIN